MLRGPIIYIGRWRVLWRDFEGDGRAPRPPGKPQDNVIPTSDPNCDVPPGTPESSERLFGCFRRFREVRNMHQEGYESSLVIVDYRRRDAEVFASATYASMEAHRSLNCLLLVPFLKTQHSTLSTWVVDFDAGYMFEDGQRSEIVRMVHYGDHMRISTLLKSEKRLTIALSNEYKVLNASGILLNRVAKVFNLATVMPAELAETTIQWLVSFETNPYDNLFCRHGAQKAMDRRKLHLSSMVLLSLKAHLAKLFKGRHNGEIMHNNDLMFAAIVAIANCWTQSLIGSDQDPNSKSSNVIPYYFASMVTGYACIFMTRCGLFGIASTTLQVGDDVAILDGSDWPAVLREKNDSTHGTRAGG